MFKKDYILGLDIGSTSVKIAQFKEEAGALTLVRAELKEITPAADKETKEKETISALRYLFRGINTKRSRIVVAINCPQIAIKKVVAPYMPKSELREGISLESKNYFPFPVDTSILDFEILGEFLEKGVRKYEVMVGVCPIKTSSAYVSLLEKAGIKPTSVISSSYALQKLASKSRAKPDEIQCLVDIGAIYTELVICKGPTLAFSRKIPVSGDDFTKAMTSTLVSAKGKFQLTMEEAERIKRSTGIPSDTDKRLIDNKFPAQQILAMLRQPAEHLVNEISRCFDYYREEAQSGKIDLITIFGGGASLAGIAKFMSDYLGVAVRIGDPVEGLKARNDAVRARDRIAHCLDIAIGAALSESKGINLLPAELKNETSRVIKRGTMEAAITAAIIIALLFFVGTKIKISNFNKRISVAKMELASLRPELKKSEARRLAEMVLKNEPYWEDVFKELGSLIPNDITMENIKMSNDSILMKGVVTSQDGQQVLANFIITLEKGLFSDVKLIESKNLPDRPGIEFEIKCWIDYER